MNRRDFLRNTAVGLAVAALPVAATVAAVTAAPTQAASPTPVGSLYADTVAHEVRVWSGYAWVPVDHDHYLRGLYT